MADFFGGWEERKKRRRILHQGCAECCEGKANGVNLYYMRERMMTQWIMGCLVPIQVLHAESFECLHAPEF